MKGIILVIASVFILGMFATDAQAAKYYGSSKSNTTSIAAPSDISMATIRNMRAAIERQEKQGFGINEERLNSIARELGIPNWKRYRTVIEREKGKVRVLIFNPGEKDAAQKALTGGVDDTPKGSGNPLKGLNLQKKK